jgi:hypothetical protein
MNSNEDRDPTVELLSQTLSEEAAMVQPTPGALQSIQQRTRKSRVRDPWVLGAFGAGLATAAVITAVVVIGNNSSDPSGSTPPVTTQPGETEQPTGTGELTQTAVEPNGMHQGVYDPNADAAHQFTIYYVGPSPTNPQLSPRLYAETHTVSDPGTDPRLAAVNEFLTSTPIDPDYESDWPEGVYSTGISESDGVTTVDLSGSADLGEGILDAAPGVEDRLAVSLQGLLATLDAPGPVAFTHDGAPLDRVLYQNVSPSISTASDMDVRAWITIDNIVEGQTVTSPVTVQLSGNVFEGNVNWILVDLDHDSLPVDDGFTTTSMGTWSQAEVRLGDLEPGTYLFIANELSAEDGNPINTDDKTFTVE